MVRFFVVFSSFGLVPPRPLGGGPWPNLELEAPVNETMHAVRPGLGGSTTEDDRRTALRFVLGRHGWRVEARATPQGGAHLWLTTPCPETGGQRVWRATRTHEGLQVHDEVSGQRLCIVPTLREALVEVWEAVTEVAPD